MRQNPRGCSLPCAEATIAFGYRRIDVPEATDRLRQRHGWDFPYRGAPMGPDATSAQAEHAAEITAALARARRDARRERVAALTATIAADPDAWLFGLAPAPAPAPFDAEGWARVAATAAARCEERRKARDWARRNR